MSEKDSGKNENMGNGVDRDEIETVPDSKAEAEPEQDQSAVSAGEQESSGDSREQDADQVDEEAIEVTLERVRQERDEFRDRYLRALAELANVRKISSREQREASRYGATRLARDILSLHDNLERALGAVGEEERKISEAFLEGIELTYKEFTSIMGRHGIVPIAPAKGDKFDPKIHQAMFEAPVPGFEKGSVIQVMSTGFRIHDRLLRPAQVGVASEPLVKDAGEEEGAAELNA